jgi:hypothetical protein
VVLLKIRVEKVVAGNIIYSTMGKGVCNGDHAAALDARHS